MSQLNFYLITTKVTRLERTVRHVLYTKVTMVVCVMRKVILHVSTTKVTMLQQSYTLHGCLFHDGY